jgi:hypothetical protein
MTVLRSFPRVALTIAAVALMTAGSNGLSGIAHADNSGAPTVEAYANAPGWITVAWTSTDDPTVDWYTLQREDNPSVRQVEGSGTFTDTGLKANTTYSYQVCAVYDYSEACSPWVSARTLSASTPPSTPASSGGTAGAHTPAGTPTDVKVSAVLHESATLSWTPGSNADRMAVTCKDSTDPTTVCGMKDGATDGAWHFEHSDATTGLALGENADSKTPPTSLALSGLSGSHTYVVTVCDNDADSPTGTPATPCAASITFTTPPWFATQISSPVGCPTCQANIGVVPDRIEPPCGTAICVEH